jgi:hypothetical protein
MICWRKSRDRIQKGRKKQYFIIKAERSHKIVIFLDIPWRYCKKHLLNVEVNWEESDG